MNRTDVVAQFGAATLAEHNFFARAESRPWELGIVAEPSSYLVYRTNERNVFALERRVESESEALELFAKKLRFELARREREGGQRPY
jgi:hypothetical protein